jgi:hypothetical protein
MDAATFFTFRLHRFKKQARKLNKRALQMSDRYCRGSACLRFEPALETRQRLLLTLVLMEANWDCKRKMCAADVMRRCRQGCSARDQAQGFLIQHFNPRVADNLR